MESTENKKNWQPKVGTASRVRNINKNVANNKAVSFNFTLSPNPATNGITIMGKQLTGIIVYSTTGKLIYQKQCNATNMARIDVSNWQNGMYFIQAVNKAGGTTTQKFIKQ